MGDIIYTTHIYIYYSTLVCIYIYITSSIRLKKGSLKAVCQSCPPTASDANFSFWGVTVSERDTLPETNSKFAPENGWL